MLHRLGQLPRAMVGMMLAHFGVAVFIFGVTMVGTYDIERAHAKGDCALRGSASDLLLALWRRRGLAAAETEAQGRHRALATQASTRRLGLGGCHGLGG